MTQYSERELKLITHFGYGEMHHLLDPLPLYKMMVEKAFIANDQSPAAEALRRCAAALSDCSVYRGTQEWDDLIGEL